MLQHSFKAIYNTFKSFLGLNKQSINSVGPNTFEELLKQFDLPPKEKTQSDIIRDYQVFITMANLEMEMLKLEPSKGFRGVQVFLDNAGNKFVDWVPCVIRPEVVYCSYGKN